MTTVVVSQPMYFPWVGLFEQIQLADLFVYYDDVQFARGFLNRVQVKGPSGCKWLTVPLKNVNHRQNINEIAIDDSTAWRRDHLRLLHRLYGRAPYVADMLALVESVLERPAATLADVALASMSAVCDYFDLASTRQFRHASRLQIDGRSTQRLVDIARHFAATRYVTGLGALKYLDHQMFVQHGIEVDYMAYEKRPYPQLHGEFTPFVTVLDLIANLGRDGRKQIVSGTTNWRHMVAA